MIRILDVSNNTDRTIDKMEEGMNINLNHNEFYTQKLSTPTELEVGDFPMIEDDQKS